MTLVEGRHWKVDPETGCWVWQKGKTARGYGRTNGTYAHRRVWLQSGRPLAPGLPLHHRCENPSCVNPDHLEPIDPPAHMRLHWAKRTTLTPEDVAEIRRLTAETTLTQQEIAEHCGISRETVARIANGRAWGEAGDGPRKPNRACLFCGEPVPVSKHRHAVFCCKAHRIKHNTRKLTERRQASRTEAA